MDTQLSVVPHRGNGTNGSNGHSNGGRDWTSLRAWSQAIGIIGIPGAIAIFLVYIGATEIPKIARVQAQLLVELQQNRDRLTDQQESIEALMRVVQRACFNAAKDENGQQRCFDK